MTEGRVKQWECIIPLNEVSTVLAELDGGVIPLNYLLSISFEMFLSIKKDNYSTSGAIGEAIRKLNVVYPDHRVVHMSNELAIEKLSIYFMSRLDNTFDHHVHIYYSYVSVERNDLMRITGMSIIEN